MATAWLGATAGQPPLAAQINQFLGTHAIAYVYTGLSLGGQTTLGSGSLATNGQYIAQSFVPGAAQSPGRFLFSMSATGSPGPLTVSIEPDNSGSPSGTALASTTIPAQWVAATQAVVSIPIPCTLTAATYWIVFAPAGDASDYYSLYKSNQTSGVSTSPTGSSWTGQAYGLYYGRYDQSVVLPLLHTWEDQGARITALSWASVSSPTGLEESTTAQGSGQYTYSTRALTYSGSSLLRAA